MHNRVRPCVVCGIPGDYWTAESAACRGCGNCVYCGTFGSSCLGRRHRLTASDIRYIDELIAAGFPFAARVKAA